MPDPGTEAGPSAAPPADPSWAPVVVDEPVHDFEPRPPAPTAYRPDTIFDGWSTPHLTVRLASTRGYAHRYHGVPRQDDAQVAFHPNTDTVVFAVADGVSSAPQSHVGATVACQTAIHMIVWQLSAERPVVDLPRVLELTANELIKTAGSLLRQEHPGQPAVEAFLGTTLIAGYIRPVEDGAMATMIQIGDSGSWILRQGRYHGVLEEKNDPRAEIISSAVSPLPRIPAGIAPVEIGLQPDDVLLIGTDGFGDPLGDGDGKVGRLFAEHLATPPPARAFAHLLDFSRETFDDDRALVAVWPRRHVPGARP